MRKLLKIFNVLNIISLVLLGLWIWKSPKTAFEKAVRSFPVRKEAFWVNHPQLSFEKRVFQMPREIVEQVYFDSLFNGYDKKPSIVPVEDVQHIIEASLQSIPREVKNEVAPYLLGVYPGFNLGSSGFTFAVFENDGVKPMGAVVVIDMAILAQQNSNWMSEKEKSLFNLNTLTLQTNISPPPRNVAEELSAPAPDTEQNLQVLNTRPTVEEVPALTFLLLHEFGHISAMARNIRANSFSQGEFFPPPAFTNVNWKTGVVHGRSAFVPKNWTGRHQPPFPFFKSKGPKFSEVDVDDLYGSL